jgi:hypothetical protein
MAQHDPAGDVEGSAPQETHYDRRYASADEVDGLRRSFDSFVQKQEHHNDTMALNLDQIMSYMTRVAAKVGVVQLEDKGSNYKAAGFSEDNAPKNTPNPRVDLQTHKSVYVPEGNHSAHPQYYVPPNTHNVHYYDSEHLEGRHRATDPMTHNYAKGKTPEVPYDTDVEYLWNDCPWTPQEIEAFNPFPTHPPHHTTYQPHFNPHRIIHHPPPVTTPPASRNNHHENFSGQLQIQHKAVAKGPKLSFPEFDGSDPDGWIRKAEK